MRTSLSVFESAAEDTDTSDMAAAGLSPDAAKLAVLRSRNRCWYAFDAFEGGARDPTTGAMAALSFSTLTLRWVPLLSFFAIFGLVMSLDKQ